MICGSNRKKDFTRIDIFLSNFLHIHFSSWPLEQVFKWKFKQILNIFSLNLNTTANYLTDRKKFPAKIYLKRPPGNILSAWKMIHSANLTIIESIIENNFLFLCHTKGKLNFFFAKRIPFYRQECRDCILYKYIDIEEMADIFHNHSFCRNIFGSQKNFFIIGMEIGKI